MSDVISPRGPLTVKVANVHLRHIAAVSAVLAGIGGAVLVAGLYAGSAEDQAGGVVGGAVCLVLACFPPVMWRTSSRMRRLVLDAAGVHMTDPHGESWEVAWRELEKVTFAYTRPDLSQPKRGHPIQPPKIELTLSPVSEDFRDAHPELEHLADETTGGAGVAYTVPLGSAQRSVGPIDDALNAFAAGIYVRGGRAVPRGVRRPWAVVASVAVTLAFFVPAMGYNILSGATDPRDAAMGAFWSAVVVAWLLRVWTGGPLAIGVLKFAARLIGGAVLAVMALMVAMGLPDGDSDDLQRYGGGVLLGAGLLVSGLLLGRDDVRRWSEARAQGR